MRSVLCLMTAALAWLPVAACSQPAEAPGSPPQAAVVSPSQANLLAQKVWRVTAPPDRAPGSIYVFHPDGTLLMTSCVEVYRLARWSRGEEGRITIREDPSVVYEGAVETTGETDRLRLRLFLRTEQVVLSLEPAAVPFVCPDPPR